MRHTNNYSLPPHSPDVAARDHEDDGFSKGWGMHFQPCEEYLVDSHAHLDYFEKPDSVSSILRVWDDWFATLDAYRLGSVLAIVTNSEMLEAYGNIAAHDSRFSWIYRMRADSPDIDAFAKALDNGSRGLKIHNAELIEGKAPGDVWLKPEWSGIFELLEKAGLPLLWHVTQRKGYSPYHGGGEMAYWKDAPEGSQVTNEKLLATTLEVARRHPGIPVIGAHQMHLGLERLRRLLETHENLYLDTSCGFVVRWCDTLYPQDADTLREFFMDFPDRIMFGTDSNIRIGQPDQYAVESFLAHVRFLHQLHLPQNILRKVAAQNAEHIYKIPPVQATRRDFVRP